MKKSGCLKVFIVIVVIAAVIAILIAIGNRSINSPEANKALTEDHYKQAQELYNKGKYVDAKKELGMAPKSESDEKSEKLKKEIASKIDARKKELEKKFEIKEDKVENVKFITPKDNVMKGLTFYPYIGVRNDKSNYMLLCVGYQEKTTDTLLVFTSIKVRAGEELQELKFNPLNKQSNLDILGSGRTEMADVEVDSKVETLLNTTIPKNKEVIVRFEDISNKVKDYTLSEKQRQAIADVLEYYAYLQ